MDIYECHGHIFMDGMDFRAARERHKPIPDEVNIREHLWLLQRAGVSYFRDGGDNLGASLMAKQLAPEFDMEYVTPVFAIHRRGRYGGIVGRGYETPEECVHLVEQAKAMGADFIKFMFSGIMNFSSEEPLSCPALSPEEIAFVVKIAHDRGLRVMAHVNGREAVMAAARAGTDSIEHGYFTQEDCLRAMADNGCIWVPTLTAVEAFLTRAEFPRDCVEQVLYAQYEMVSLAASMGIPVASGSDAGAVGVPHGGGILRELDLLKNCGLSETAIHAANERLRMAFRLV